MDGNLDLVDRKPLVRLAAVAFGLDAVTVIIQTIYVLAGFHWPSFSKMRSSFLHCSL